jgi:uncharacterized DUF497 family protein
MKFQWDAHNRKKIAQHGITSREFEQAYAGRMLNEQKLVNRERRKVAIGQTKSGRILLMVYTIRRGRVRAITAYDSRKARAIWRTRKQANGNG